MDINQKKIARIHDFYLDFNSMRDRLQSLKAKFPSGLIIPILGNDIRTPLLSKTVEEVNQCDYLKKIYIACTTQKSDEYEEALRLSQRFKVPCDVVWCNKPQVFAVQEELKRKGLDVTQMSGKGKDVWIALGIASLELYALVVHDADIVSYTKMLPTKLLFPTIEPKLDFLFTKGYYVRINTENRKMYGRIQRLFVNPLLEILQEKLRYSRFITFLQSFNYPLSGEFAIYSDLATQIRIPCNWGLELGILAEVYRNSAYKRVCEIDLGHYDHRHKEIDQNGLMKTADDCLITLLRTLTETENLEVSESFLISLQVAYRRLAQDKIGQHHADAMCNNLDYDRHEEEIIVDTLSNIILASGKKYLADPTKSQLPDWQRAIAAMPNVRERLREEAIET